MTDDCKVEEWRKCELVPIDIPDVVPKVYCEYGEKIEYKACETKDKEIMTSKLTCEVKSEPSCKPKVVKKVITYTWESFHKLIQKAL